MVIIKFSHLEKLPTVVYEGDLMNSIKMYEKLTSKFEDSGEFMVNEINVDQSQITIVREFATTELGHIFDLILCGGVVGKVKK